MSVGIWVRKTVALGLAATLFGPSVSMLSAQEAQSESQEDKKARKQQQQEAQQRKQAEREQQQAEKRAQRESQASKQQERAQQEQQQRQQQREERTNNQQQRQAEEQRARQDQRQAQEQQRVERQRAEQEQRARQAEQVQRDQSQRQQTDQAQRDLERRQRRSEQSRAEAQAQAEAQARAAEAQRQSQAQQAQQQREAAERAQSQRSQQQRSQDDARYRQPQPGRDYGRGDGRNGRVITEQRRGEIIRENRERTEHFNQGWRQREQWGSQRAQELQRQRRYASYRYQQRYLNQLRLQWNNNDWRRYDYNRDPYFSVAPNYRYRYSGRYYEINDYGADLLRSAVNNGYEEGFLAGQADREDRWRGDYRESYAYEDASYGYRGLYVDQQQYSYYFRQGFDRGYADGYNARYEYGRRDNTGLKVLAGVLAGILVFEALGNEAPGHATGKTLRAGRSARSVLVFRRPGRPGPAPSRSPRRGSRWCSRPGDLPASGRGPR